MIAHLLVAEGFVLPEEIAETPINELVDRRFGDFLWQDKSLCDQQMRDHVIDVQRFDEA